MIMMLLKIDIMHSHAIYHLARFSKIFTQIQELSKGMYENPTYYHLLLNGFLYLFLLLTIFEF